MRIGIIAPYESMLDSVEEMPLPDGVELVTAVATYDSALEEVIKMEKKGVEVLISRGATQSLIERNCALPVIGCNVCITDLIPALCHARQYGRCVGVNSYGSFRSLKAMLETALGIEIIFMDGYATRSENLDHVRWMKEQQIPVVLGGSVTVDYANELGLKGILIPTRRETLEAAVAEAIRTVQIIRKERNEKNHIQQVVECTADAIYWIDKQHNITPMNESAQNFAEVLADGRDSKNLSLCWFGNDVAENIRKCATVSNKVQTLGKTTFIYTLRTVSISEDSGGLMLFIQDSSRIRTLEYNIRFHRRQQHDSHMYTLSNFIGHSKEAVQCRKMVKAIAPHDATVLIMGESGTGKEILAQSIHHMSRRSSKPFVAINCMALENNLLDSELFGYEEGSFTGAKKGGKIGLIEMAHDGTLFLDEIGSISLPLQAKLLRALQEKEIRRIGSEKAIPINVRVIAATNSNLQEKVRSGEFRLDLYYRLCILDIQIPPLRERKNDIILLTQHFCEEFHFPFDAFPEKDLQTMIDYNWPGNVRELRNFVERVSLIFPNKSIHELMVENIQLSSIIYSDPMDESSVLKVKPGTLDEMESDLIAQMFRRTKSKTELADILNISRSTLWKKMSEISQATFE